MSSLQIIISWPQMPSEFKMIWLHYWWLPNRLSINQMISQKSSLLHLKFRYYKPQCIVGPSCIKFIMQLPFVFFCFFFHTKLKNSEAILTHESDALVRHQDASLQCEFQEPWEVCILTVPEPNCEAKHKYTKSIVSNTRVNKALKQTRSIILDTNKCH